MGTSKKAFWRIVVADGRSPRDGRFIEEIGYYNPKRNPTVYQLDKERAQYWLSTGAQPSGVVRKLLKREGVKKAAAKS